MKVLPPYWETERLFIQDSSLAEADSLQEVFHACGGIESWDPTFRPELEEGFINLIARSQSGELGIQTVFKMQTLYLKENREIIGYFHLHHGLPKPKTVFISMFIISPTYQRQSYGQETVRGIITQLQNLGGFEKVWLNVHLKNWPALRFWIRAGFTSIVEFRGDPVNGEDSHALLILEKAL